MLPFLETGRLVLRVFTEDDVDHLCFTDLGVDRVVAHTMAVNQASRRVMDNCGLTFVRGGGL